MTQTLSRSERAPGLALMRACTTLFWDFDGVIKDSVQVKSDAFERLFAPFGGAVAARVRAHHEAHGGMSRYEKLPLYLKWASQESSAGEVARYDELFSTAVRQAVIDSAWVPGAREYLRANCERQCFVLVTATPQREIESILAELQIAACFREVHGAPLAKASAIELALSRFACAREQALLIGDSESDYTAAQRAGIGFLLRQTALNQELQRTYSGCQCEDFDHG